jgi:hypothetical protein
LKEKTMEGVKVLKVEKPSPMRFFTVEKGLEE